jgi:hypothetical protein
MDNDDLTWLQATYRFHTFAYRDPRSAFSVATGIPIVSPTAVLMGIVSTLFSIGDSESAHAFAQVAHRCNVMIDAPDGAIFFRAFHQLRRYETDKNDSNNPRLGMTKINQGIREYSLLQGCIRLWVAVPSDLIEAVKIALRNRDHMGTHDSLCSLVGDVEQCRPPDNTVFSPLGGEGVTRLPVSPCTVVTLSRFKRKPIQFALKHWHLAGGDDTELVPYLIQGQFKGTSRGKLFEKHPK